VHVQLQPKSEKLEIRNSGGAESLLPWELRRTIFGESHSFRGSFTGRSLRSLHKRARCPFLVELETFTIAATRGKIRKSRQDDNAEIEMRVQKKGIYGNAQNPRANDEITRRAITYKLSMIVLRAVWAAPRLLVFDRLERISRCSCCICDSWKERRRGAMTTNALQYK